MHILSDESVHYDTQVTYVFRRPLSSGLWDIQGHSGKFKHPWHTCYSIDLDELRTSSTNQECSSWTDHVQVDSCVEVKDGGIV